MSAAGTLITLTVNDAPATLPAGASVETLMTTLGFAARKGIAVAIGGTVVPRSKWSLHTINTGDKVLLIQATQGG